MLTQQLLKAVKTAKKFTEKRTTMPILTRVEIELGSEFLTVRATNLEAFFQQSFRFASENCGAASVDVDRLILALEAAPVNVTPIIRDNKLVFNGNELESDIFPIFGTMPDFTPAPKGLKDLLESVMHATSNDETRYHLNGVYLEIDKQVKATATDGHRLAHYSTDNDGHFKTKGLILHAPSLKKCTPLFKGAFNIGATSQYFVMQDELAGMICAVRIVEGRYPNYSQFMPSRFSTEVKMHRDQALKAFTHVAKGVDKKSGAGLFAAFDKALRLENLREQWTTPKKKNEISERLPDLPEFKANIDIKDGLNSEAKIKVNFKYVVEALKNCPDEKISFNFNDRLSPMAIECGSFRSIIMPMR